MRRISGLLVCLLTALLCVATDRGAAPRAQAVDEQAARSRNVLLIIADDYGIDLSAQYAHLTGNANLPPTPHIARLAEAGVLFENAWANPLCSPTRAGLLTGLHSFRTGVSYALGPNLPGAGLPAGIPTLPELLRPRYASGLFGKWHLGDPFAVLGPLGPDPISKGFHAFQGSVYGDLREDAPDGGFDRSRGYTNWQKHAQGGVQGDTSAYATKVTARDAERWIRALDEQDERQPWLAMVAFNAPHTPLHDPASLKPATGACTPPGKDDFVAKNEDQEKIYKMIMCMDEWIGWLLQQLEGIGQLEETTIIFIGDNGTIGNDRRMSLPDVNNAPFDGSGFTDITGSDKERSSKEHVYEGGIRVPFIVADGYHYAASPSGTAGSSPGAVVDPGRRHPTLVHTLDIFATVLEIAGLPLPASTNSHSLVPYLRRWDSSDPPPRKFLYTDLCKPGEFFQAAIRDRDHKLIYLDEAGAPLEQELYNVSDMAESAPLWTTAAGPMPATAAALDTQLTLIWTSNGLTPGSPC